MNNSDNTKKIRKMKLNDRTNSDDSYNYPNPNFVRVIPSQQNRIIKHSLQLEIQEEQEVLHSENDSNNIKTLNESTDSYNIHTEFYGKSEFVHSPYSKQLNNKKNTNSSNSY